MSEPDPSAPGAVDGLAAVADRIRSAGVPGAHLSVRGPGVTWDTCEGFAQVAGDDGPLVRPLTPVTAHDLGSVTKIAGTTAMLIALTSAGSLSPGDRVGAFLPDLVSVLGEDARLADLLTHRAGLWEWWPTYLAGPADPLGAVRALPLRYPPRAGRHYSDLGFMILGRIVEVVTGRSLPEALRDLVCSPIGISELRYAAPSPGLSVAASSWGDVIERTMITTGVPYPVRAQPYGQRLKVDAFSGWRTSVLVGEVNDGNAFHGFGGAAGHAGLFGTADALHRLGRYLLDGLDGANEWSAVRLFATAGPDPEQALGLRLWDLRDGDCSTQLIGHTGFPGIGFGLVPAHGLTVVLATNRLHAAGDPPPFEQWWLAAVRAAHRAWHER